MIFLYGPPVSGKSTLGLRLAQRLNLAFNDLDALIASRAGKTIPELFADEGQDGFRRKESAMLAEVLAGMPGVVSLGGGALLDLENRALVETAGPVLCLNAPYDILSARSRRAAGSRPLLAGDTGSRLRNLLDQRAEHYASFPLQLETDRYTVEEVIWEAQVRLGMFRVSGMGDDYDVRVVSGGVGELGDALVERDLRGPISLVSDENVAPLYAAKAAQSIEGYRYQMQKIVIPPGEKVKTIDTVMGLWHSFLETGIERGSTVIALGGGVVGDLTGFAAATFLRGVRWVAAPTSLLAMVDASLGGKTGADLPKGKNLIGAFHPPSLVIADPGTLRTLPDIELRNGLAEVVKHGVIADPSLFELCGDGWEALQENWSYVVKRAMAVKIQVILEDPYEKGRRAALNLGHTFGHAIEAASNYRVKHGEAVAIGMVAAAKLAEEMRIADYGLADIIENTLLKLNLPVKAPENLDRDRIISAMKVDTKRSGGETRFVLPVRIGEVRWGVKIEDSSVDF